MIRKILVTMARFSRLHPVNSVKKVVDASGALAIGAVSINTLANVAPTAWVDAANVDVPEGCHINSIYISLFMYLDESVGVVTPLLEWFICKNPGSNLTFPAPGATGGNDNRRWVLHEEKGLASDVGSGGTPMVFKGVIRIPRGKSRMGMDDQIQLRIVSPNHQAWFCLKAIYKFYQ